MDFGEDYNARTNEDRVWVFGIWVRVEKETTKSEALMEKGYNNSQHNK